MNLDIRFPPVRSAAPPRQRRMLDNPPSVRFGRLAFDFLPRCRPVAFQGAPGVRERMSAFTISFGSKGVRFVGYRSSVNPAQPDSFVPGDAVMRFPALWSRCSRNWNPSWQWALRAPLDLIFPPICAYCLNGISDEDADADDDEDSPSAGREESGQPNAGQPDKGRANARQLDAGQADENWADRVDDCQTAAAADPQDEAIEGSPAPGQPAEGAFGRVRYASLSSLQRLCPNCRRRLSAPTMASCARCAVPLIGVSQDRLCNACRQQSPPYCGVACLGRYENELRAAVLRMKHPRQEWLADALVELLWSACQAELTAFAPEVIVPAPMHWRRRWLRGWNSPECIAEQLARRLRVPALPLLRRTRNTQPQGALGRKQRQANLRGAFALRPGYATDHGRILLVDDVMTSGATAAECSRVLLADGAAQVMVAVLARAPGPT